MVDQNTKDEIRFSGNQSCEKRFRQLWELTGYSEKRIEKICGMFLIKPVSDQTWVLDAGCGHGMWSKALSKKGYIVVGTDVSNIRLKAAKKWNASENTLFVVGDLMKAPIDKEAFHACLVSLFFHHFRNPESIIAELLRVNKKGGEILIFEPNGINIIYRLTESIKKIIPRKWMMLKSIDSTNETIHSTKTYVNALKKQGFSPIKILYMYSSEQECHINGKVVRAFLRAYGIQVGIIMLARLLLFKIATKIPIKNLSCGDLIIHAVKTT